MRQKTNRPRDGWALAAEPAGQAGAAPRGSGAGASPRAAPAAAAALGRAVPERGSPERSIPHPAAPSPSQLGSPKVSPRVFPTCQHTLALRWKQRAMLHAQPLASCLPRGLFCSGRAWR